MSEVVFVGTSDAFGAGGRRQSAIVVRGRGGALLLDCGVTTATGLNELGISRDEIDAIAISHFHGDHFGGVPQILLGALYEDARRHPLWVAGPVGVEARVRALADAMGFGLDEREWTFPLRFQELPSGREARCGPAEIRTFETHHQPEVHPHGLVVSLGGERVAYSGDTGWFDALPRRVAGSDLFICECTFHSFEFEYHLNHGELVARRDEFDCGRIVLTHLGSEMTDRRGRGPFETADDGLVVPL